ncbi:MAG: hypothetical protein KGJ59_03400 [Bacteroidota bacterium]|nr:hypothetical protein [Bacteroidota bacterium]
MHYYRIYDDHEELNFFKSTMDEKKIEELLKEFERERQQYFNLDFMEFLRKKDVDAEIIEVENISY